MNECEWCSNPFIPSTNGLKKFCSKPCREEVRRLRRSGHAPRHVRGEIPVGTICYDDECEAPSVAKGLCNKHYLRFKKHGDTKVVLVTGRKRGIKHGPRRDRREILSYDSLHARIRSDRGSASLHSCQWCGSKARDWGYDHTDPEPLICPKSGSPYSMDIMRYMPLCRGCHTTIDKMRNNG